MSLKIVARFTRGLFFPGLTDWEDSDVLSKVLATSQQEYLDSLKQTCTSGTSGSETSEILDSNNS